MSLKGVILQVLYSSVKHYNKEYSKILFHVVFKTNRGGGTGEAGEAAASPDFRG